MTQIRHHAHRDGVRKRRQRQQHPWRRPSGGERVGPPPLQTSTRDDVLRRLLGRRRGAKDLAENNKRCAQCCPYARIAPPCSSGRRARSIWMG